MDDLSGPDDGGTKCTGEFFSLLRKLGLKPVSPDFAYKTDMRRQSFTDKRWIKIAGVAILASVTWTLTYDHLSKGILEAKRETAAVDTVTGADYIVATVVFLTTTGGSTTWTKDSTWNDNINKVEIVGTGGRASNGSSGKFQFPGVSAGGGAYTFKLNVSLAAGNPAYQIGAATVTNPIDCWFVNTSTVLAKSSLNANGGAAASCVPSANAFSGGNGSGTNSGGAAGPHGAGSTSAGDGGTVAANTSGTTFDATHGCGGGRTGGGNPGPTGMLYGGGGGASSTAGSGGIGGNGAQGLIVLTWTPPLFGAKVIRNFVDRRFY